MNASHSIHSNWPRSNSLVPTCPGAALACPIDSPQPPGWTRSSLWDKHRHVGVSFEFRGSIFRTIRFLTCSDDDHVVLLGKFLGHGVCVLRASLSLGCVSRSFVSNAGGTRRCLEENTLFWRNRQTAAKSPSGCQCCDLLPDSASAGGERQLAPYAADTPKWTYLLPFRRVRVPARQSPPMLPSTTIV